MFVGTSCSTQRPSHCAPAAPPLAKIAKRSAARPELSVVANRDGLSRVLEALKQR
jgi:hypothetical protein